MAVEPLLFPTDADKTERKVVALSRKLSVMATRFDNAERAVARFERRIETVKRKLTDLGQTQARIGMDPAAGAKWVEGNVRGPNTRPAPNGRAARAAQSAPMGGAPRSSGSQIFGGVSKIGGVLGPIAGAFGEAASMGGIAGAIGAGAAAAAVGVRALVVGITRLGDEAARATTSIQRAAEAQRTGARQAGATAASGLASVSALAFESGISDTGRLNQIISEATASGVRDALPVLTQLARQGFDLEAGSTRQVVEGIARAQATGRQIDLSRLNPRSASGFRSAGWLAADLAGVKPGQMSDFLPFFGQSQSLASAQSKLTAAPSLMLTEQGGISSADQATRMNVAETMRPAAAAMAEISRQNQMMIEALQARSEAEGVLGTVLGWIDYSLGSGKGSAAQQIRAAQRAGEV